MLPAMILATEILSGAGYAAQFAKNDAWLSIALSTLAGVWPVLIMTSFASRYPGLTLMEYSTKILGKWVGKLLGGFYIYFLFILLTTITDELMTYVTLFTNPRTPRTVTIALFLVLCGIAVWLGIEVIARSAEVFLPFIIFFYGISILMLIPDLKPEFLQPVLGHGLTPVLRGAIIPSGWMGEFVFVGMLLPYFNQPQKVRRYTLISVGTTTLVMLLTTLVTIMVVGPLTGKFIFPFTSTVQYISFENFIERIDALILGLWIFGGFIKDAVFLWVFCQSVSQLFGLKDYRVLVVPVTLSVFVGALWVFTNMPEMTRFLMYTFPALVFTIAILIPTLLWSIDSIRRWRVKPA